jgi:signal transduction histidine kinase
MLFATILLAWFGHYFTRGISRPVSDLASMADRIADGERDISSDYTANNEIGQLARALNGMTQRLTVYESKLARQSHLAGLGDLAARMAHEVRNPLTALKMQLQLLQEKVPEDDVERVSRLLDEIRRMELIVDSALTLGAPLQLNRSSVNSGALIDELAKLLQPALRHRGIDLQTVVNDSPEIDADPDRLRQVLLNLINNAADELPDGGVIRVSSSVAGDGAGVELTVEDSGPGLPPETAEPGRRKPFGLGLGLIICHEIVELHGGEFTQGESAELGGARFTVGLHAPIIEPPG